MVGARRSRFRHRRPAGDDAPVPLGWAALGIALVVGLFVLVLIDFERSSAVVPATSTGTTPQAPAPETWILSSTVAAPGPTTEDTGSQPHPGEANQLSDDSGSLIIRVPAVSSTGPSCATPTAPTALTATSVVSPLVEMVRGGAGSISGADGDADEECAG